MDQLRVGVIGLGRVALLLESDPYRASPATHLGAWRERGDCDVVAGCDPDKERRAHFLSEFPSARCYESYQQMLAHESLDLVSVCGYATDRADMVEACCGAGVRGIWCEKAVACSVAEIDRMQVALERSGTELIVSFMRRWDPRYQCVAQMLQEGAIGRVETISATFSGNLIHTGTHAFDVMEMVCGPVVAVQGWLDEGDGHNQQSGYKFDRSANIRDVGGFATLYFENGVRGVVNGSAKRYFIFEFEIIGSEGLIRIGNQQTVLWTLSERELYQGIKGIFPSEFPAVKGANPWSSAADNLVGAVRNSTSVDCGIDAGRRSLQVALALHESQAQDHGLVELCEVSPESYVPSR